MAVLQFQATLGIMCTLRLLVCVGGRHAQAMCVGVVEYGVVPHAVRAQRLVQERLRSAVRPWLGAITMLHNSSRAGRGAAPRQQASMARGCDTHGCTTTEVNIF